MASSIGTIGAKVNPTQNTAVDQSFNYSGSQRVVDGHGRYTDLVARAKVFLAANQAGAAITALNSTATGFILGNPTGGANWFAILRASLIQTSTAAGTANAGVQLAFTAVSTSAVTHTTPLTVRSAQLGNTATATGTADSSATVPSSPIAVLNLWQPSVSGTATVGIPPVIDCDLGGLLILIPGTTLSFSALSALSGAGSMFWEEFTIPTNYA